MTEVLDAQGRVKVTPPLTHGMITLFSGATIPEGWALCDGTNGTPDLTDRFIVGDTAPGLGTSGGTVSLTAALTHFGASVGAHSAHSPTQPTAHGDHSPTQPVPHDNHVVGQAATHSTHSANATHTHGAHATGSTTASTRPVLTTPFTHSANIAHTHDAHVAHSSANLDAHSAHSAAALDAHTLNHSGFSVGAHDSPAVTQSSAHAIVTHYILAYIMFRGV